jgi:hydrogenase maturation protease
MEQPRLLIACIGNIFLGDDAFGVEVARRLVEQPFPAEVQVIDFGIRGLDLAYALLDGYEAVILVDAVPRGEAPGTLYVLELDAEESSEPDGAELLIDAHSLDPARVLRVARAMGARVERLLLVGCEPESVAAADDIQPGLSAAVGAAVDEAVPVIKALVTQLLAPQARGMTTNPAAR